MILRYEYGIMFDISKDELKRNNKINNNDRHVIRLFIAHILMINLFKVQ